VAVALPAIGLEDDMMCIVVTREGDAQTLDRDAVALACVPMRLLDLADDAGVHLVNLPPADVRVGGMVPGVGRGQGSLATVADAAS
jgi:hypothetical protein